MSQTDLKPTTGVRLPLSSVVPVLIAVASAGVTWGILKSDIEACKVADSDMKQAIKELRAQREEDSKNTSRMMEVLGRIDERTSTLARRIESSK